MELKHHGPCARPDPHLQNVLAHSCPYSIRASSCRLVARDVAKMTSGMKPARAARSQQESKKRRHRKHAIPASPPRSSGTFTMFGASAMP